MEIAYTGTAAPTHATAEAAGYDLTYPASACPCTLSPHGGRATLGLDLRTAIPPGYAGLVLPRSGLATHHGVTILNAPGLIDADYRGPWHAVLVNHGPESFVVEPGSRVAQVIVVKVESVEWTKVAELPKTARGEGGLGSTGR